MPQCTVPTVSPQSPEPIPTDEELLDVFIMGYMAKARDPEMDAMFDDDYDAAILACDLAGVAAVSAILRRYFADAKAVQ